jgi:hypothetical protein
MPDTPTVSLRARKQSLASNSNVWGDPYLNANLDIFDAATTRFATLTSTGGVYTLTNTDYDSTAEAIAAGLLVTGTLGTGMTIVAPARRKMTAIRNTTTGQTVTWGVSGGLQATVPSLSRAFYYTDGTDAFQLTPSYTASGRITNLIDPAVASDAATKNYVDGIVPAASGFFSYAFSTTTGDTDPGAGVLKLDTSQQSGATAIYISTTAGNGGNNAAWLDSLANSTQSNNRGQLVIREAANASDWVIYNITSVSGASTYRKLNVTLNSIPLANPLSDAANVILFFSRTGDGGPIGPTGATGATGPAGPTGGISGGTLTGAIDELRAPDIVVAATTDVFTTSGNYVYATGSGATITSLGTATQAGARRTVIFDGVNTLTNSGGLLVLPNRGQNIITAPGDRAVVQADTTTQATIISYQRATGMAALSQAQTFSGAQRGSIRPLTASVTTVAVDFSLANYFSLTVSGTLTLQSPTNMSSGQAGGIYLTNSGGTSTLAYGAAWSFAGQVAPSLTATAGAKDFLVYWTPSATTAIARLNSNFSGA